MEGDAETTPDASGQRGRWDSPSTWIALAIILTYAVFTLLLPIIPILITAGCIEDIFLYGTPAIALILWLAAMTIRVFVVKNRRQLIWTGFRYAVIAAGVAGFLIMAYGEMAPTPRYIRGAERFAREMNRDADIAAIRAWAATYKPSDPQETFVPKGQWRACVARLHPSNVYCSPDYRRATLYFGGGFRSWRLIVAPVGTQPAGYDENYYTLGLQDGAWVEYEK